MAVKVKLPINIPSAFSPNGDGLNDVWIIKGLESYPNLTIDIFNRWGSIVYRTNGYDDARAWDGTIGNGNAAIGTYYYVIDLKDGKNQFTGALTIIK